LRQLRRHLLAQESGNPLRIGREHGLARNRVIERHQDLLAAKHQVGGVFGLTDAPVVALDEHVKHGTQPLCVAVQSSVQHIGTEGIGQNLRALQVGDAKEGVSACAYSMPSRLSVTPKAL